MGASAVLLWPRPSPAPPSDEGPWKLHVERCTKMTGEVNETRSEH